VVNKNVVAVKKIRIYSLSKRGWCLKNK